MATTTDEVNVQITGTVAGLQSAMASGANSVRQGTDQIASSLSGMVEKSDADLKLLSEDLSVQLPAAMEKAAASVSEGSGQIAGALDGMSSRFTSVGVGIAFAVQGLADGAETGVNRALRAVSLLGFAFGPEVGGITLAISIATKEMVNYFSETSKQAAKAAKDFQDAVDKMVDAGSKLDIRNAAAAVWFGSPSDIEAAGLAELLNEWGDAKRRLAEADNPFAKTGAEQDIKRLTALIDPLMAKFTALRNAMNAPLPNLGTGLDAVTTTAVGPKTEAEEAKNAQEKELKDLQTSTAARMKVVEKFFNDQNAAFIQYSIDAEEGEIAFNEQTNDRHDKEYAERLKAYEKWLAEIDAAGKHIEKFDADTTKKIAGDWLKVFQPAESALNQWIQTGNNLREFWRNLWYGMVQDTAASLIQMTASSAERMVAAVKNITVAGSVERLAIFLAENLKMIAGYAVRAAAATWAAISDIPIVGPFLAPAAAAAALAGVLSLAGGLGGGGGGGSAPATASAPRTAQPASSNLAGTVNIYAMDSKSFAQFAADNHQGFAAGVQAAIRMGSLTPKKAGLGG